MQAVLAVAAVFLTLFVVPILVYGAQSAMTGLQPPGDDPAAFLTGVARGETGDGAGLRRHLASGPRQSGSAAWAYVALWWLMFVLGEIARPSAKLQLGRGHRRDCLGNDLPADVRSDPALAGSGLTGPQYPAGTLSRFSRQSAVCPGKPPGHLPQCRTADQTRKIIRHFRLSSANPPHSLETAPPVGLRPAQLAGDLPR